MLVALRSPDQCGRHRLCVESSVRDVTSRQRRPCFLRGNVGGAWSRACQTGAAMGSCSQGKKHDRSKRTERWSSQRFMFQDLGDRWRGTAMDWLCNIDVVVSLLLDRISSLNHHLVRKARAVGDKIFDMIYRLYTAPGIYWPPSGRPNRNSHALQVPKGIMDRERNVAQASHKQNHRGLNGSYRSDCSGAPAAGVWSSSE